MCPSPRREIFEEAYEVKPLAIQFFGSPKARELFEKLDTKYLPFLPAGYRWTRDDMNKRVIEVHKDAPDRKLELYLYEPLASNEARGVGYNFLIDGRNTQSFAPTLKTNPNLPRKYPLNREKDYGLKKGFLHFGSDHYFMPGHCIDHADTVTSPPTGFPISTYHNVNFIPEPANGYWGKTVRNNIVKRIRKKHGYYMQQVQYTETSMATSNDTTVGTGVYFFDINADYSIANLYNNRWKDEILTYDRDGHRKRKLKLDTYLEMLKTSTALAPVCALYNPDIDSVSLKKDMSAIEALYQSLRLGKLETRDFSQDKATLLHNLVDMDYRSIHTEISLGVLYHNALKRPMEGIQMIERAMIHGEDLSDGDVDGPYIREDEYKTLKLLYNAADGKIKDLDVDSLRDRTRALYRL